MKHILSNDFVLCITQCNTSEDITVHFILYWRQGTKLKLSQCPSQPVSEAVKLRPICL